MISFDKPFTNASGTLGFVPYAKHKHILDMLGAFFTNPISINPRKASLLAHQRNLAEGILLHSGMPNPGLAAAIKNYAGKWARASVPIIVHLISENAKDLQNAMLRLEDLENLLAVEVSFEPQEEGATVSDLLKSAQGELPIIAQLPKHRALDLAQISLDAGVAAISLASQRLTHQENFEGETAGRLFGPMIYQQTKKIVAEMTASKFPILASGGIFMPEQANELLSLGVKAVQLDTVLWRADFKAKDWK